MSPVDLELGANEIGASAAELGVRPGGLILAVLGYSTRMDGELHPVCAARVQRALQEADAADAVILSGWARRGHAAAEAELMRDAWPHEGTPVVLDALASTTAEAAARAVPFARAARARELRVVTSVWHERRATYLFRRALNGSGIRITAACVSDRATLAQATREVGSWLVLPVRSRRFPGRRDAAPVPSEQG